MTQANNVAIESSQINSSGVLQIAGGGTGLNTVGSSGYVLQSTGSAAAWVAFQGGATITPTTTNTAYFLVGTSSTSGSLTTASISVTSPVSYNASNGTLSAPVHYASQGFHTNANTNTASYTVATGQNAVSAGPFTVATSTTITIATGSRWVVV